jgi:zinc transport system permease protein
LTLVAANLPYPFELGFMQRALVAALAVGVFAPVIGTFVVQKKMSLIGDGIGHFAFAGVGAGLVVGGAPLWTALGFAVVGSIGVEHLRSRRKTSGDLALALLFYSGIAAGVVLVSLGGGMNAGILTYLFGQPLTVSRGEVAGVVALAAVIVITILSLRRLLFATVSDEDWSRVVGLPVSAMNNLLAVLIACSVVAAMRIVGILLVSALMVLPVAGAQRVARSFVGTLRWAVVFGVGSAVVGLALARIFDLAPGGSIVLVAAATFGILSVIRRRPAAESTDSEPANRSADPDDSSAVDAPVTEPRG